MICYRDDLASNAPVVIAEGAPLPDPQPDSRPVQPVTARPVRPLATTQVLTTNQCLVIFFLLIAYTNIKVYC